MLAPTNSRLMPRSRVWVERKKLINTAPTPGAETSTP